MMMILMPMMMRRALFVSLSFLSPHPHLHVPHPHLPDGSYDDSSRIDPLQPPAPRYQALSSPTAEDKERWRGGVSGRE